MNNKRSRYLLVVGAAVIVTQAAAVLIPEKNAETAVSSRETEVSSSASVPEIPSTSARVTLPPTVISETSPSEVSEKDTETAAKTSAEASSESSADVSSEASSAPSEESKTSSEAPSPDYSHVAFIGDSRTLFLGSGQDRSVGLVPNDALFATFSGTLTGDSAFSDAAAAGRAGRGLAVFWFGVNDSQVDPERDNASVFLEHYRAVIDTFRAENSEAEIIILSVVGTSVTEWSYYEGQEQNIANYNEALKNFCSEQGYRFIDLGFMNTSEADFLPDGIHFTAEWYSRFVPAVTGLLGL